jgi:sigma-B regulation protein RsbQ
MNIDVQRTYNVSSVGTGDRVMLFAHGLACDNSVWRFITPALENDYKLVLFDFIGSGNSDTSRYDPQKYSTLDGYADDILQICDALSLTNVILIGHSVSAMIGVLATIKRPEIFSRLIMIGPSPRYINDADYFGGFEETEIEDMLDLMQNDFTRWAGYFAPTAMGNGDRPELSQQLEKSICSTDPEITIKFAEVTFLSDNRDDLKNVTTPSLILQMAEDIVAPTPVGEYVHRNTPGSTLYYMQATGHFPHLSAPEETIMMMKKYLE